MSLINLTIFREGGRNPYVDWTMILIVSTIVAVVLVWSGVDLYSKVISGNIEGSDVQVMMNSKTFSQKNFDSVIQAYNEKADAFIKAKSGYSRYADPSK